MVLGGGLFLMSEVRLYGFILNPERNSREQKRTELALLRTFIAIGNSPEKIPQVNLSEEGST